MSTQMLICLCIFVFMLVSFLLAKIPLGVTASCVAILLTVTKCVEVTDVLGSIGNANTVIIASMIILASGLGRTSLPVKITNGIRKATNGNYKLAYLGVLLIALLLKQRSTGFRYAQKSLYTKCSEAVMKNVIK